MILKPILIIIGTIYGAIFCAAVLIWIERRLLALFQDRLGPNRVGPLGMGIVLADIIKMFTKDDWIPPFVDKPIFILAPTAVLAPLLLAFGVMPWTSGIHVADLNIAVLYFLAMSSLTVYGVLLGGMSSHNKYSLLGGLRAAAQMVSYEVFMGLSLMGVVMITGSFSLKSIVEAQQHCWFIVSQFLGFVVFSIAGIAETHRMPFDLPEAEQELVGGFHTEYSGMKFGMFMLGEYIGIVLTSSMITTLFLGGWLGPHFLPPLFWFGLKALIIACTFILLRAALPRPRYDQLMSLGWKVMLPLALANLLLTGGIVLWMRS